MQTLRRLFLLAIALVVLVSAVALWLYRSTPTHNTDLSRFDTIIVLGYPANPDGSPSPEQRERTLEAIREYRAGVAPTLIFTGGPAHNSFTEAHVMATLALAQGVPSSAILEEDKAQNTIQNIFYSRRIMEAHRWNSAEVISSPSHLPRTALILEHYTFAWRTHAAPWPPEYSFFERSAHYLVEMEYGLRLHLFGFPETSFLPARS